MKRLPKHMKEFLKWSMKSEYHLDFSDSLGGKKKTKKEEEIRKQGKIGENTFLYSRK